MADSKGLLAKAWGWLMEPVTKHVVEEDGFIPADAHLQARLPRTAYNYSRAVGNGMDSNVIMAPVGWIMRNFTEADPVVERRRDGVWEVAEDHELEDLLIRPNPFYDGDILFKASLISYCLDGNIYWQKVRNAYGGVIGLWYVPHFLMEPKWPKDGSEFITHYEYTPSPGGEPTRLAVRDVVHIRNGLDPRNIRKGFGQLKPLLREVFTDEEAANFSASILRNMGVPGGIISPKSDPITNREDAKELKDYLRTEFTGDRRGGWLAFGYPTEVKQFGYDPNNLMLGNLRDIAEERVCAMLGIPAAVVGFGSGLQSTKVGATMRELRREAWDSCITPMQHTIAKQVGNQLLPDYQTQLRRYRVRFDNSAFAASQEEEQERTERITKAVLAGVLRVDKAQAMLRHEVDEGRKIYLVPNSHTEVPAEPEDQPPPPSANGNGRAEGADIENRVRALLSRAS